MINTLTAQFDHVFSDLEERTFLGEIVEIALDDAIATKGELDAEAKVYTVEEYVNNMGKLERKIAFLEMLTSCLERR